MDALGVETKTERTAEGETTAKVTLPKNVEKAKVTIPAVNMTATTVAVIVDANGEERVVSTSVLSEDGISLLIGESAQLKLVDNAKDFGDVAEDHWATEAVDFVTSRELFQGTSEGVFNPTLDTSRAMLFTILARLDGVDTSGGENWYDNAMAWSVEAGISDGSAPDSTLTREQLATMLYRFAGRPETDKTQDLSSFSDSGNVSVWASESLTWAVQNGLINGKGDGTLDPSGSATRAEMAAILTRFVKTL